MQPEAVQKETIQFKEVEFEAPAIVSDTVEELKQEQEVTTVFHLDELEVEKELTPIASETTLNDIDVEYKIVSKEEVLEQLATPVADANPFDRSINESVNLENEKRKEQLKKFNYTFKNNINKIEEMEKQPAYKRLGFDIDDTREERGNSQISVDTDTNEDIQFRSNNSFLHDNVD
jgi:cell division protein FtsZ